MRIEGKVQSATIRNGNKVRTVYFDNVDNKWIASPAEISAINKFVKGA